MSVLARRTTAIFGLAVLGLATVLVTAGPTTAGDQQAQAAASPQLIAIKFHADWCGSCKAMGDVFTDLANKLDGQPVLFVEIDQTNRTTAAQAQFMVAALGAGELWGEFGGKTGFVLVLDAESRQVVAKLTHEQSVKDMTKAITDALATKG